jgi:hypothetical protein
MSCPTSATPDLLLGSFWPSYLVASKRAQWRRVRCPLGEEGRDVGAGHMEAEIMTFFPRLSHLALPKRSGGV